MDRQCQSSINFPVPHKKMSLDIKGIKMDIIISTYDDHILVMATPMLVACARYSSGSPRTLLLSLGLKDHSLDTLKTVVSSVTENSLW
ncbi:hypothetical protein MKW92_014823 [Papaver armeniacum]|nr:hypothetical protein MKW92_014823 [Papaver armeniacum]